MIMPRHDPAARRRIGKPLQWKFREAILALASAGLTRRAIAKQLTLAKRTVDKYASRRRVV